MAAPAKSTRARPRAPATIRTWEDDPLSSGAVPVERPAPTLPRARLKLAIDAPRPAPGLYEPGTPEFRWWVAAEALVRSVEFWQPLLPPRATWQRGDELVIRLDFGDRLNAYYNRQTLTFFHAVVAGQTVYTAESPDVVAHECGHAVLDLLRPQLWDAMSHEVAALHESFGDCAAILTGLQLPSLRSAVLAETGGPLFRSSRISRVAEQLGWAVRQRTPCAPDPDCLRNAVSCFFYDTPDKLPIRGSSAILSSEPHSYSRVFTSAFLLTLGGMMITLDPQPGPDALQQATVDAGRLLVAAVQAAPIVPNYLSQVAAHILAADEQAFAGRYAEAIRNGFVSRGLMTMAGATRAATAARATAAAAGATAPRPSRARAPELATFTLSADDLGLGDRPLLCQAPAEPVRLAAPGMARDGGPAASPSPEESARGFVRELVARNRLARPPAGGGPGVARAAAGGRRATGGSEWPSEPLYTHEVVEDGDALRVVRRLFDRGLRWAGERRAGRA